MSRFAWRPVGGPAAAPGPLAQRFRDDLPGATVWRTFIGRLLELAGRPDRESPETYRLLHELFDGYVGDLDREQDKVVDCCVFVSHKRCDVAIAERIAWVAVHKGFDYWLDVHDPLLPQVANQPIASPFKETIIAALVEMALLNATHLIAVHTPQSHTSLWVPYEIGRAKSRDIWSSQVSGWFQTVPDKVEPIAGEYTYLMERLVTRADIERWLASQPPSCTRPHRPWQGAEPAHRLPGE